MHQDRNWKNDISGLCLKENINEDSLFSALDNVFRIVMKYYESPKPSNNFNNSNYFRCLDYINDYLADENVPYFAALVKDTVIENHLYQIINKLKGLNK